MLKQNPSMPNVTHLNFGAMPPAEVSYLKSIVPIKSLDGNNVSTAKINKSPAPESPVPQASAHQVPMVQEAQLLPSKTASKQLYFDLNRQNFTQHDKLLSQLFLNEKLLAVEDLESDLPASLDEVLPWLERNNAETNQQYQDYLGYRKNGGARQLFTTKSHAYNFLQSVAPTKLVDGSWLYGITTLWQDHRFSNLIKIYLEELGDGDAAKNHVLLYKKLLAAHECDHWKHLSDDHFIQGAIQLSLGYNAAEYIPEVIGFNLGYEQLPLHLLITVYELNELGIDPYYFTLHVTVDNLATGHAKKALQALFETMPALANTEEFYRRVNNGYKLNQLGISTNKAIASFNLNEEFFNILKLKALYGQSSHSDKCKFKGKTVNEWLSQPAKIQEFINSLIEHGWIKRNQDPRTSRFWKLIEGDTAKMFGVFSGYEKQVIFDWIADSQANQYVHAKQQPKSNVAYLHTHINSQQDLSESRDPDVIELESRLAAMEDLESIMKLLTSVMTPSLHHTPAGLLATQLYKTLMYKGHTTSNAIAFSYLNLA